MLDAAEQVFGLDGFRDGSLRRIGELSGFSTAAIYLFFENKQQLLTEMLSRRGEDWSARVASAAERDLSPLDKLHAIVDMATAYFAEHPDFLRVLGHLRGEATLARLDFGDTSNVGRDYFVEIRDCIAGIIEDGQEQGDLREGHPRTLAHLFSLLVNEFLLLGDGSRVDPLAASQFHALVGGAFGTHPDVG
ncbi:MAG TPA: TetR/AcrR family transcriptional regulator [Acidimicrobiales bacterium]|jgi:AcrR family transcriptional regulator|nr:TetR/AcrR family transcriptional regulator [Acidimicrobiales bacterium]